MMFDEDKIQKVKRLGQFVLVGLLLVVSYGLGVASQVGKTKQLSQKIEGRSTQKEERLTQDRVKEFLLAYYTKADLGENRKRYKPFMTANLYQEQTGLEEEAVNKAYQGYIVNYQFKEATVYLDTVNQTALVTVRYTNTLLAEKGKLDSRQLDASNEVSLKLRYQLVGKQFLVDKMETVVMTTESVVGTSGYGTLSQRLTEPSPEGSVGEVTETSAEVSNTEKSEEKTDG